MVMTGMSSFKQLSRVKKNRDNVATILYHQIYQTLLKNGGIGGTYGGRWWRNKHNELSFCVMDPELQFAKNQKYQRALLRRLYNRNKMFISKFGERFYGHKLQGGYLTLLFTPVKQDDYREARRWRKENQPLSS